MAELTYLSADSHVYERGDLWITRVDNKFREAAPRVIRNTGSTANEMPWVMVGEGLTPFAVSAAAGIGLEGEELKEAMKKGYEAGRPGAWDPAERIKDQEIDGVVAEVIYPTLGMILYGLRNTELQQACFNAYNTWMGEFCAYQPKRFLGVAMITLADVPAAVKELERCAKLGLRGSMIWSAPPQDRPYDAPVYDPFWSASAALKMPATLHCGTTAKAWQDPRTTGRDMAAAWNALAKDVQDSLTQFIFGGVFERHPGFRMVSVENDIGWFKHYVWRADRAHEHYGAHSPKRLPRKPSEYMHEQVYATFEREPLLPEEYQAFGEDNFMWASDYPHGISTWPHSREIIGKVFGNFPAAMTRKIIYDNVVRLYQ